MAKWPWSRPDLPPTLTSGPAAFTVRRVIPPQAVPEPPPQAPLAAPEPPPDELVGRFQTEGQALACAGAVLGGGGAAEFRRAPDGAVWLLARGAGLVPELIWSTGGEAYEFTETELRTIGAQTGNGSGAVPPALATLRDWPAVSGIELAARHPVDATAVAPPLTLSVVVSGLAARWVLQRCLALGGQVGYRPVRLEPVGVGNGRGALLLRVSVDEPPRSLVHGLAGLPGTWVCRSGDPGGALLLDVRYRLPVPDHYLAGQVPAQECWLLAGPDHEIMRVRAAAGQPEKDAAELFAPEPAVPAWPGPAALPDLPALLPEAATVQLVPSDRSSGQVDAVLVSDADLDALRRFLAARPLGETAFLLVGPGHHLLTEPGGLIEDVPVGLPLHHLGPGGFYVEAGCRLNPPLPSGARAQVFGLGSESVVAFTRTVACRFSGSDLLPAWSLWLSAPPKVVSGLSERGRRMLAEVAAVTGGDRSATGERPGRPDPDAPPPVSRQELLRQAMELEHAGRYAEAAARLEEAGDFLHAGRMFERAARLRERTP